MYGYGYIRIMWGNKSARGVAAAVGNLYLSKLSKSVDDSANANLQIFINCQLSSLQIL